MSAHKLPAVRLTADGDCVIQEGVSLDLPPSNKFSVSYASSAGRRNALEATQAHMEQTTLNTSDGEPHTSDGESGDEFDTLPPLSPMDNAPPATSNSPQVRMRSFPDKPTPGISRTLSMPLPSQLSQLQHPHRPSQAGSSYTPSFLSSMQPNQVHEVSMELADSIQLVIQTMLQISPPQVLDPAKEQFSACALSVPTSSMSAMFTAMKNINYISANMSAFCEQVTSTNREEEGSPQRLLSPDQNSLHNEFDIGEMLQCVGDALSGAAAQAGVDLVLYHGDIGLKHVYVSGDESGLSFALSHVVRQVLGTTERGDSIELGLFVSPISNPSVNIESPPVDDMLSAAPLESNGPVRVKIRISHKFAPSETHQGIDHPKDVVTTEIRAKPAFSTLLLRRILKKIDGNLVSDLPPPEVFTSGRTCELELVLDRVPVPIHLHVQESVQEEDVQVEPTLELLSSFGETLKGKRVTLYASAKGSFAHHLTSYLTAWGMDVTHVSPDGQVDGLADHLSSLQDEARLSSFNPLLATYAGDTLRSSQNKSDQQPIMPLPPNFILVDDDVDILRERLQASRFENLPQAHNMRKRPSLSTHHRPRSSPQMARLMGLDNHSRPAPVVIMHFTSLSNYKLVRDVMQSVVVSYAATSTPVPEVMIIPKPAGPRRFLTALHTAVTKPVVDPLFMPIATSPMSPGVPHSQGSFFSSPSSEHGGSAINNGSHGSPSQTHSPSVKNGNRPPGSRSNSDRSTRSNENSNNVPSALPPSPLAFPDNAEYFSAAAERLGTSPSSGLVIQSPDGQTAGIYFHPRSKNGLKNPSSQLMERDRGQLTVPSTRRRSTPRMPSGGKKGEDVTFSSLHEVTTQTAAAGETTHPSASPPAAPSSPSFVSQTEDQSEQPSSASGILAPVPRRASDGVRKLSPPSGTPEGTPTGRRASKRTDSKDSSSASAKQKGKSATSDNVVPPISVLIVDDNPINQTILSTFMRRKKIKYDLASNGQEAVQKWRTGGFHLILMDIQMPVMDGIQATKEIRRLEKSNAAAGYPPSSPTSTDEGHTPSDKSFPSGASSTTSETRSMNSMNSPYRSSVIIVALTASSLQSDRVAALAAGCNDFLTKPVSLLWLNNKIIEWGSIKALQMWADIRPESVKSLANGQAAQARNVAEKLHVPIKGRTTPTSLSTRKPTSIQEDNAAAIALASPAGSIPNFASAMNNIPSSPTSTAQNIPDRPPSTSSQLSTSGQPSRSNSLDAPTIREALNHPFKRKSIGKDDDTPKPSTPQSRAMQRDTNFSKSRSTTPVQTRASEQPLNASDTQLTSVESVKTRENGYIRPQEEPSEGPSQPKSPTAGEPIHEVSP